MASNHKYLELADEFSVPDILRIKLEAIYKNGLDLNNVLVPILVGLITLILTVYLYNSSSSSFSTSSASSKSLDKNEEEFKSEIITSVPDEFEWNKETPRAYRPFKAGPFFMTMGIKSCSANDWLLLENTYQEVTNLRASIVENHKDNTVLAHEMASEAVDEAYDLMINYMMHKYPKYFYLDPDSPGDVYNSIKGTRFPATAEEYNKRYVSSNSSSKEVMDTKIRLIAKTFEEDFLILIFDEESQQYFLRAGSFAFPTGFSPAEKLNLALKDIHGPVPLYKEKIELSMDRFFSRIKVNQWVQRYNWGIQSHTKLYAPTLNHAAKDTILKPLDPETMNFDEVLLRCERQILTRLPKTNHLLFTIRTYTTPLSQIREEGRALELVEAIDNLPDVMGQYKKRAEWGPAVKSYLRRETDGLKKE